MRRAVLGIVAAVLLPVLAGCGSDGNGHRLFAADVVSTQASDGDVTQDPVDTGSLTAARANVTKNVRAGMDVDFDPFGVEIFLSESRGFLRFALDSIPPDADVRSAVISVFVNDVSPTPADPQSEIPFLIELIDTDVYPSPFAALDFGVSSLFSRRTFFKGADESSPDPVLIDVTNLLREALALGLSEFEVRLTFDQDRYFSDDTTIARRVTIDDGDVSNFAPLLQVDYF